MKGKKRNGKSDEYDYAFSYNIVRETKHLSSDSMQYPRQNKCKKYKRGAGDNESKPYSRKKLTHSYVVLDILYLDWFLVRACL